jgi:type VI secretion system protein ImpJ
LVTETPPPKYVSLPLVRVQYQNETFALTDFLAPTFTVPLRSPLSDMGALIARRLREKAVFLSEKVRAPSAAMGAPLVLEAKNALQSLVAALPYLEAVLSTGVSHPYLVYLALCSVAGHVAALGTSLVPPALAPYNHRDLRATFGPITTFIMHTLDEGIPESYTAFPFVFADGLFSLQFEDAWLSRRLLLAVRGQTGMSERDVITWVEECLIGSRTRMQSLREKRILGAARHPVDSDAELVPSRGVVLFALRADPEFIEVNEVLQIFNTTERWGTLRPADLVLYVKNSA